MPTSDIIEYHRITSINDIEGSGARHAANFQALHALETRLFPKDVESQHHYKKMLAFNNESRIQALWGNTQYTIIYARHRETEAVLGAILYLTIPSPDENAGTIANQFTFVDPEAQGFGIASQLLKERADQARSFLATLSRPNATLTPYHEIVDPFLIPLNEHRNIIDTKEYSPFERIRFWGNRQLRAFAFPYVIPRTAEGIPARHQYQFYVGSDTPIARERIKDHVITATALCYLHGEDPRYFDDFSAMIAMIDSRSFHETIDKRPIIDRAEPLVKELLKSNLSQAELALPAWRALGAKYPHLVFG